MKYPSSITTSVPCWMTSVSCQLSPHSTRSRVLDSPLSITPKNLKSTTPHKAQHIITVKAIKTSKTLSSLISKKINIYHRNKRKMIKLKEKKKKGLFNKFKIKYSLIKNTRRIKMQVVWIIIIVIPKIHK